MMKSSLVCLFVVALFVRPLSAQSESVVTSGEDIAVVETKGGKVRGYIHNATFTYKGIHYAAAKRFMPPKAVEPWSGTRFMGYFGPTCPVDVEGIAARANSHAMFALQHNWGYPSEDCQTLNVWTPGINDEQRRPVMVWIHGGGYEFGSAQEFPFYDGESLSKRGDVVVVTVNHRLNILGFLDLSRVHEKYRRSANVGLQDLVAALKWVRHNIEGFGGDPENVTIFGQSGGGGKITALLNSPAAEGYFHRAVVQSGSFATEWQDPELAKRIALGTLRELQIEVADIEQAQQVPYHDLLAAGKRAIAEVRRAAEENGEAFQARSWGPVADGEFLPPDIFGQRTSRLIEDVPLLIGTTKTEFALLDSMRTGEDMEATFELIQDRYGPSAEAYLAALKKAYPDTSKASDYLAIDFMFRRGAVRDADLITGLGHDKTYMYLFAWESPVDGGIFKSMHNMELPFVFHNIYRGKEMTGGGKDAYQLAHHVSDAWINFARAGAPAAAGLPEWPNYTAEDGATMIINNQSEVRNHHDRELLKIAATEMDP